MYRFSEGRRAVTVLSQVELSQRGSCTLFSRNHRTDSPPTSNILCHSPCSAFWILLSFYFTQHFISEILLSYLFKKTKTKKLTDKNQGIHVKVWFNLYNLNSKDIWDFRIHNPFFSSLPVRLEKHYSYSNMWLLIPLHSSLL